MTPRKSKDKYTHWSKDETELLLKLRERGYTASMMHPHIVLKTRFQIESKIQQTRDLVSQPKKIVPRRGEEKPAVSMAGEPFLDAIKVLKAAIRYRYMNELHYVDGKLTKVQDVIRLANEHLKNRGEPQIGNSQLWV